MAKGSVRKKGKKWYARFYIEDESGRKAQKEFVGTESKSETEALLRKAIADYEEKKFVAKSENITVGMLLDLWVEEELKPGNLSNGTVMSYQGTVNRIKQHPIGNRKLKTVTADHLQAYIDFLSFGGTNPDGTTAKALSKGYLRLFSAVLQGAFRFAVFPKRLITFNPMQYVVWRGKKEEYELFSDEDGETASTPTLSYEQYQRLEDFLKKKNNPALLPIQIAYYTGLRIGEVCGLTWQDINLEEQYLTVRRSMRYNGARHKTEIGATKRKKIRTVDFCDTLAAILKTAKTEQHKNRFRYGELYSLNYYWRSKKKTAPIMRFTVCRGRRKSQRGTRNYPLSALDLTGHLKHRVRWGLCVGQQEKRWRDWRISTSICSGTPIQAICFQTVQHLKMCRNFSDTLMSVPQ